MTEIIMISMKIIADSKSYLYLYTYIYLRFHIYSFQKAGWLIEVNNETGISCYWYVFSMALLSYSWVHRKGK